MIVYLDGDYSALPGEMARLLAPLQADQADLVLGSWVAWRHWRSAPATPPARGQCGFAMLVRLFYGAQLTDAGPSRAIRSDLLRQLALQEEPLAGLRK